MHRLGFVAPRARVTHHHLVQRDAVGTCDEGAEGGPVGQFDVRAHTAHLVAAGELTGEHRQGVRAVVTMSTNDHPRVPLREQRQVERLDGEGDPAFPDVGLAAVGIALAPDRYPRHVVRSARMDDLVGQANDSRNVCAHGRYPRWCRSRRPGIGHRARSRHVRSTFPPAHTYPTLGPRSSGERASVSSLRATRREGAGRSVEAQVSGQIK